jgi:hypothetical protein
MDKRKNRKWQTIGILAMLLLVLGLVLAVWLNQQALHAPLESAELAPSANPESEDMIDRNTPLNEEVDAVAELAEQAAEDEQGTASGR